MRKRDKEMESLATFQNWLTEIDENNFKETITKITQSVIFQKKSKISFFHEILSTLLVRPKKLNLYSSLISELFNDNESLKTAFLDFIFTPLNKNHQTKSIAKYYLLKEVINQKSLDFQLVLPFIKKFYSEQLHNVKALLNILVFSSLLFEHDKELLDSIISSINEQVFELKTQSSYYDFAQNIVSYLQNDCNKLFEITNFGAFKDSLPFILKTDDFEQIEVFIQTHDDFNPNAPIGKLPFELCPLARKDSTVFMYAALYDAKKCFSFLMKNYELSFDAVDKIYNSFDAYAIAGGNMEIISKFLLDGTNLINDLPIAAQFRQKELFDVILSKYVEEKDEDFYQQIFLSVSTCASANSVEIIQILLESKEIENKPQIIGLLEPIVLNGHYLLFEIILSKIKTELSPDICNLILSFSVSANQLEIVQYLVNNFHASPNIANSSSTPLIDCISNAFIPLFDFLLSLDDIDVNFPNADEETPLICAAKEKQPIFIQKLLKIDTVNINAKDEGGFSALFYSVKNGDIESISLLLSKGAFIEYDDSSVSALHIAAENENPKVMKLLLDQKGININKKDSEGKTPLHICVSSSDSLLPIAKILVEHGADINSVDNMKSTPLHYAVGNENYKIVEFLSSLQGIDKSIVDSSGWTPLRIAQHQENQQLINLLK